VTGCPRHAAASEPFLSLGARGSHMRRVHGIHSITLASKRPPGGDLRCPYPECADLKPYVSRSGRESHLRNVHGAEPSQNRDSVRRRLDRAARREAEAIARAASAGIEPIKKIAPETPPPPHPNVASYQSTKTVLTPGEYEHLRRRLLFVVNGQWTEWIGVAPVAIRNGIERICQTNFAVAKRTLPPPVKKRRA